MKFIDNDWCGMAWTEWVRFSDRTKLKSVPSYPGIYRIKPVEENSLAYIGQTSRSLRKRSVSELVKHALQEEMPFNDPHTAAPSLWTWHDAMGMEFEVSVAKVEESVQERKALESYLLWRYRVEYGESTLCNHGRFHKNYFKSKNRSMGIGGGRLPDGELNPAGENSSTPLQRHGRSIDRDWMGLFWSEFEELSSVRVKGVPTAAGLYKLIDLASNEIVYIGQSKNLRNRLQEHAKKSWEDSSIGFSYVVIPAEISKFPFRMSEWENDLIGAFYDEYKRSPRFQFVDAK